MSQRKLRRVTGDEWIAGVCSGVAYYLGIQTWIVRMILFILIFAYGVGIVPYILLWIFMPTWKYTPDDYYKLSG